MDHAGGTNREKSRLEAAQWVLRLASGSVSAEERAEFEAWRKTSLHHEVIYQWESLVWDRTERLKALRPPDDKVDCLLLTSLLAGTPAPAPARWRRLFKPLLLAASLALALAAWLFMGRADGAAVYATAVGERRIVDLSDGSRLELNTNTEAAVRYSRSGRRVELLKGKSLFNIEPDADRPFKVAVGDNTVRVVGTAFNIRRDPDSTHILVTEGVVEVTGLRAGVVPFSVRLPA